MGSKDYDVTVTMKGVGAYVIDKLTEIELHGSDRRSVIEKIVSMWVTKELPDMGHLGITVEDAEERGYIERKK